MRIPTTTTALADLEFIVMEDLDPATMEPAKEYGKDDIATIDGKQFYRISNVYVKENGRHNPGITVKVMTKPTDVIPELTKVHLTGSIVITPWIRDNRVAYSIVADALEPVED